jgi:hypothetical protein
MPFVTAHFVTLDRQDGGSRAGAEISHTFGLSHAELRFDAHALYVDPDSGIGGYVTAPGGYGSTTSQGRDYFGNVEAGAMVVAADNEERRFTFHAGVAMPTHWSARDNVGVALTSFSARLTDLPLDQLSATTLRAGLSWQGRDGSTFAQLDIAVDDPLTGPGLHPALRINGGGGVDLGPAALTIETVNILSTHTIDGGAVGVRINAGPVQPYAAFVIGLVQVSNDKLYEAATVGLDAPL